MPVWNLAQIANSYNCGERANTLDLCKTELRRVTSWKTKEQFSLSVRTLVIVFLPYALAIVQQKSDLLCQWGLLLFVFLTYALGLMFTQFDESIRHHHDVCWRVKKLKKPKEKNLVFLWFFSTRTKDWFSLWLRTSLNGMMSHALWLFVCRYWNWKTTRNKVGFSLLLHCTKKLIYHMGHFFLPPRTFFPGPFFPGTFFPWDIFSGDIFSYNQWLVHIPRAT